MWTIALLGLPHICIIPSCLMQFITKATLMTLLSCYSSKAASSVRENATQCMIYHRPMLYISQNKRQRACTFNNRYSSLCYACKCAVHDPFDAELQNKS
ncbi:uncharacterized protein LY89DRAFT_389054 [Mollisia scopiformis]|uniref:Secreted protein n=1 Tax=Mollisia scopiformis TaxID=149040 RepID=A0A194XP12_MOLSC|nr:uncharacterized protein LY89DRAFT_389054 [Mollisia scopiformis]KUJ21923.1 hypothetical protein LY89DRAFT_389054 [Mollisia scopiformis]